MSREPCSSTAGLVGFQAFMELAKSRIPTIKKAGRRSTWDDGSTTRLAPLVGTGLQGGSFTLAVHGRS